MNPATFRATDYALLMLRLSTLFVFIPNGISKALNWPMSTGMFASLGFPSFLGPITGMAEVIASLLILVVVLNKWATLAFLTIMAGAIAGVHLPASWAAGSPTAGLERDVLLVGAALILMAFGPGAIALNPQRPALDHLSHPEHSL